MELEARAARLDQAAALLPNFLRQRVLDLPLSDRARAEELRLRVGQPLFILGPRGEIPLEGTRVAPETLRVVLELASGASVHTVMEHLRGGFLPLSGGHRLGLCGTGVIKDGVLVNLRQVSSVSLRVAREHRGIAGPVLSRLWEGERMMSTLILSPPGAGKTTLLRDMIRTLSRGDGCPPLRVGVADERGELAAMTAEGPGLDVGPRTDVMTGCPKETAMTALLRGMNPQVLAVDEITASGDVSAMTQAAGCGVVLLATAHAAGAEDLSRRPLYRHLMAQGVFERLVCIKNSGGSRQYTVTDREGTPC